MKQKNYKIKKVSTTDLACERIRALIADGTWPAGYRIPSEMELAERLGVNRLTARIAIQRLCAIGLLDIRVGDGTYVRAFDLDAQLRNLADFYVTDAVMGGLGEYRALLQLGCVELSAARRSEEEAEALSHLCGRFQDALRQLDGPDPGYAPLNRAAELALEMNGLLCAMAHNDLVTHGFSLMREPLRRTLVQRLEDGGGDYGARWQKLSAAIGRRSGPEARAALQTLLET